MAEFTLGYFSILFTPAMILFLIFNLTNGKLFFKILIILLFILTYFSTYTWLEYLHIKPCPHQVAFNFMNIINALSGKLDLCNHMDILFQISKVGIITGYMGSILSSVITYLSFSEED